jgi:hypothetical protein
MSIADKANPKRPRLSKSDIHQAAVGAALPTAATVAGELLVPGAGGVLGGFVGSLFVGLVGSIVSPTVQARAAEWYQWVEDGLKELQATRADFCPDDPATRDTFTSTLLTAIPIALRTSQEEKFHALRNAVLNSSLPSAPTEDMITVFMTLIDSSSVLHLRFLKYLADPEAYYASRGLIKPKPIQSISSVRGYNMSPLEEQMSVYSYHLERQRRYEEELAEFNKLFDAAEHPQGFCNKVLQDLFTWHLLNPDLQTAQAPLQATELPYLGTPHIVTLYGYQILEFISDPVILP